MDYRSLGHSGIKVSVLCLGTMNFGGATDEPTSARIVRMAREQGVNFVDTADQYTGGRSEADRGARGRRYEAPADHAADGTLDSHHGGCPFQELPPGGGPVVPSHGRADRFARREPSPAAPPPARPPELLATEARVPPSQSPSLDRAASRCIALKPFQAPGPPPLRRSPWRRPR